jgi:ATP-dependent RNA helicase RhlE
VQNAATTYGRYLTLKAVSIYGGASMDNQLKLLRRGADIIVATPGRLLDHMERGTIQLSKIEVLVLDEADRMLDMGFINEVRKILAKVPRERQTLLFSATLSSEINALADRALRDPQMVEVGERRNPVETITQQFYSAPRESKMDILLHALETGRMESVLVFSRTKHGADKISRRLERKGITSVAIHSNRTQSQRERALEGFKRGKHRVMVATDIAARGIDVTGISHVINFDIPHYAEDYIHRIGRTGRAGATGDAITLVGPDEMVYLKRIEQFTGKRFRVNPYPGVVARASAPAPRKESSSGRQPRKSTSGTHKQFSRKKKQNIISARKKKRPLKKLEAFSSDAGSKAWSNY